MRAVVFFAFLSGLFGRLATQGDYLIPLNPASSVSNLYGNSSSNFADVRKFLATFDSNGHIASSRLVIHCVVDSCSTEGENALRSCSKVHRKKNITLGHEKTNDSFCNLLLLQELSLYQTKQQSEKETIARASFSETAPNSDGDTMAIPWFAVFDVVWANVEILIWSFIYVKIIIYLGEMVAETEQRTSRFLDLSSLVDILWNLCRRENRANSDQSTSASPGSTDSETNYSGSEPAVYLHHDYHASCLDSSASSRSNSRTTLPSESGLEISHLEKCLASGSAVILEAKGKGSRPTVGSKLQTVKESLRFSNVSDFGDGLGKIYDDSRPQHLLIRSSPAFLQNSHHLDDPIFHVPREEKLITESWLRIQSLPNIHQAYRRAWEDPVDEKPPSDRCDSDSQRNTITLSANYFHRQNVKLRLWRSMCNAATYTGYFSGRFNKSLPFMPYYSIISCPPASLAVQRCN